MNWSDKPGNTVVSFAGEIGGAGGADGAGGSGAPVGLAAQALPQDDEVIDEPGTDITVDVLDNDLGALDSDTLAVPDTDSPGSVVQVGGRQELDVALSADPQGPVPVDYTVCATAATTGDAPEPAHGCATATLTVTPETDLPHLTVAVGGPDTVDPGDEGVFPITITNSGSERVYGVSVVVKPPDGYQIDDLTQKSDLFDCQTPSDDLPPNSLRLSCTAAYLAPGDTTLALVLDPLHSAGHGDIAVRVTALGGDNIPVTAKASHAVTTGDPADIAVTQTGAVVVDGPYAGDLAVDVTMTTAGGTRASAGSEAAMSMEIPDGAGFVALTAGDDAANDTICTVPRANRSGYIACNADAVQGGPGVDENHAPVWHLVLSPPPDAESVTLTAYGESDALDPDESNNTATKTYAIESVPTGPKDTPTVTLTGPAVPVATGANVPLHVTVTPPDDDPAATGTVTLLADGAAVGDPVALDGSGAADLTWTATDVGSHQLSAHYNGDDHLNTADSSTLDATVAPAGPDATVALTAPGALMPGAGALQATITNAGTEPGTVAELDLTVPDGVTLGGSLSSGTGPGFTCTGAAPARCVPVAAIVLGPGASTGPITVPLTIGADSAGGLATATVVMADDVNPENDSASTTLTVTTTGLTVSMSGPVTDPLAGQTAALTLTVGNLSATDLPGPTTVDVTLPNGTPAGQHLTYQRADTPGWACRSANLRGVTVVTCRTAQGIPAGTRLDPLPVTVTIPATAALGTDLIRYDARGGGQSATGTPLALAIGPSRPSHVTATLIGAQELSPSGGDYVLDVANEGAGATTGPLTVSVPLPAGVTAATGAGGPWDCAVAAQSLTCTLNRALFAGSDAPELPVRLTADPAQASSPAGLVSLVATARTTDATGAATGIGAAALRLPPAAQPLLQLAATTQAAGRYSLAVQNSGTAASTGPVTVTETLPAGFTATVDTTGTPWSCAQAGAALSCTATGLTIPAGGSAGPPVVSVTGPSGVAGSFALSGQVLSDGTHSAVTGTVAHVTLPPRADANPATSVTLGDSPLYDGEHSTATMHLRPNGSLTIGSDVLFALVLPHGVTVDPAGSITVDDDVPEPSAGSINVGFGGGGSVGGTGSGGTTSQIHCQATTDRTAVACISTYLQADSIGSVTIPIVVSDSAAGTAFFYSGIVPYSGLGANLNYAVNVVKSGGVSAIGSLGLTKATIGQFTADAGAPQNLVDSTPGENGGQTPTVVDLDASGTTAPGRTLTYGWVQTMGPPVAWRSSRGTLQPGQQNQAAFPAGTQFTGIDSSHSTASTLTAPSALGVKPSFTAPTVAADTLFGFRVYVTDGNSVRTADTTVTLTAVADQPPTGTMTARDVTAGTNLADGGQTPAVGDQIEVTVTTADADGDAVQTAVSVLRPANIGTAIAPEPGEISHNTRHFTFAWPSGAPQLTLQAQFTDGHLAPDGSAVASYATLSIGPAPEPVAVTVTGAPTQPATPGQKVTVTAAVAGVPDGSPAPAITWTQVSGPTVTPAPATGASTVVTIPAGVKAGESIVLQAAAVVGSGADAQAAAGQVTIAVAPPPPLAVSVTNFGTLTVATGATLALTATGSGGTAPITYKWTKVTGAGTLSNDSAATASYKAGTATGFDMLEVTATDANHQTATQDVPVQIGTAPAASTTPGTAACSSTGAIGSLFGQQAAAGATGHYLLKLGAFTIDLGHLDLGGKSCTPDLSISVGGNPGDNITATLGPLTFSHIKATLSMTKLTLTSATVATPSEWHLGSVTAQNIVIAYDPFAITGSITWADQLPLLSKPGTASSVSTSLIVGKDTLTLNASANVAGGSVTAVGAISTASGDFALHVTAANLKIFDQAFSGAGDISDAGGHVTGDVTVSWSAGKTADVHGLHLTSASLTWNKDGITAQAAATIAGRFTVSLKANYDDTDNWSATVTGGLAADWDVTSGLTLKKSQTSLSGTISDKKGDLTFNVAISISGSWTAGPVTLTNLNASFANATAPKKSCGVVPQDDIYLTIGGKATIKVGDKSIALTAEACIVPATGAWTIASTAALTGVTLVSDLTLTGISLTVAHSGSQYSAVLVGTATSHGVTGSVQVALIDGSTGLNFLAAATIDLSSLGVSLPGCGALIYSTEAISDLSTVPGLDLGLTSVSSGGSATTGGSGSGGGSGSEGSGSGSSSGGGSAKTTAGGTGGCGSAGSKGAAGSGKSGSSGGSGSGGSGSGGSGTLPPFETTGSTGHALRSTAHAAFQSAVGSIQAVTSVVAEPAVNDVIPADAPAADAPAADSVIHPSASPPGAAAPQRVPAPQDVISGTCSSSPIDSPSCFGTTDGGTSFCTFLPTDFAGVIAACPDENVTPNLTLSYSADACETAAINNAGCFDVGTDGAICTIDDVAVPGFDGVRSYLPTCGDGYLPLAGAPGGTGPAGLVCADSTVDDDLCFGTDANDELCTYYPSGFVGIAWLPTCGLNESEHVTEQPDGDTSCLSANVYDQSCFAVGEHGQFCTPDAFSGTDDDALRELVPLCADSTYRALPAADADDQGQCTIARIDDGTCFGYEVLAQDTYQLCTYYPDDFADVAWLDTCVRGHNQPATQLQGASDVCAMAVANDPSCYDVDADGTYCTIDAYRAPGGIVDMHQLVPTCDPGAVPLLGAPVTGGGGVLGCVQAPIATADCFGFTSDPPTSGGFCTFDAASFIGTVVIQPCPRTGSIPVTTYVNSADACYQATLADATCFRQNSDDGLCTLDAAPSGGVLGASLAAYLPNCDVDATPIDTGSGSTGTGGVLGTGETQDSGAGTGPGNTGAAGTTNNPAKGIGIPAGFTAMASFTLPVSMKDFLSGKLGLPQPLVDSDLVVQVNLSGTPVIKATLTAGDGGIVLMHNDSNGTKLTLQSISLTISLGGSFGLSAQGGLDLPKPDAKTAADVAHLTATAAVSIQVSGIPSITISLSKTGDVWQDAFGVTGLDLGDIAIQGGIVFSSPPTPSIGFGANIVSLPEPWRKPLGIQDNSDGSMEPVTFVVNISAANPILQISLGVPDGHVFLEPMQPIASILPLSDGTKQQLSQVLQVDDASLIIAPYGGSVGSFTFTPGFHVRFDATMLGVNVNVKADVGISPPAIDAHVDVGAFGFGGLNMDETRLDLSITPTTGFMAHFSGGLSLGGASTTATLDAKASLTGGMTFDFESDISHIGYGSMLSLDDLDIFGHGSYTSLKQVPSVTFGMTATAHLLGAGMTVYGDVELGLAGIQGFDILAAPHPVSLGGVVSVGGNGCNAAALADLPDVPALPTDGPCVQLGYHPLQDPVPTVDINGAIHTSAGIDVAASLTLDDTGLAASGSVQLGPLADVDVSGHLYFGSGLGGVKACDETSVLDPSAACHQVAVHQGDFVFSAALASQVSLAGMSANLTAGIGHLGNHDWVVGRAALGILNTSASPIHANVAVSGAFYHNDSGVHFDLSGAGSVTLGGSVSSSGHIIGGYSLASASFELSSDGCNTLSIPGVTQLSGANVAGCAGFTGTLGQAGGPLPSVAISGVVANVGGVLRFQASGAVDISIAGFTLANASLVAGNMSGPVTVTVGAHTGLGSIVTVDGSASVSADGNFCISGGASFLGTSGGASACTAGEPHPGVKVWFTTYGFSVSGYIGPDQFAFTSDLHLNPHVAGTFAGITLSAYADFTVHIGLYFNYPVTIVGVTQRITDFSLSADGKVGVNACAGHFCIGPSLDVGIEYNPGFGICVGTSLLVTDIKICYNTSSGLQVVKP